MIENQAQAGVTADGQSAGTLIRQGRERAGLHIAALAVALKVPVKRLEALEADRYDLLPGSVFVRALASSVCRALKLDVATVLAKLPDAQPHALVVDGSLNRPFRSPSHRGAVSPWWHASRPALVAGGSLLLAAALVYFLPDLSLLQRESPPAPPSLVTEQVAPAMRAQPVPTPAVPAPPAQAAVSTGGAAPAAAPAVAPAAAPAITAAGTDPTVFFSAKKATWVEVVDASGTILLRRVLGAGEEVPISAAPVLRVAVGNVGGVEVKVRGQTLDLGPMAQNNVARFEVK